jgi:4-hydroxybenzoate polyprenyltransferase
MSPGDLGRLRLYLQLGRVSNLPTVWTNVLTGIALAGGGPKSGVVPPLLLAFSLFYTGGMFLNDAFDRHHDARTRPDRPIPAGLIPAGEVFGIGYGLLATALLIVMWMAGGNNPAAMVSGVCLATAIIVYDAYHKKNPLSPWLMGLCRMLIYATTALIVTGSLSLPVIIGATALLLYIVALTAIAKQSYATPRLIGAFIAGICILDALLILGSGDVLRGSIAALGFPATLLLQRSIQGT